MGQVPLQSLTDYPKVNTLAPCPCGSCKDECRLADCGYLGSKGTSGCKVLELHKVNLFTGASSANLLRGS